MSVLYDHCTKRVREKNAVRLDGSESTVPRGAQSPASWRHTARIPPAEGPVSDQLSATGVASSRPYSRIAEYSWFRRKEGPFAMEVRNHGGLAYIPGIQQEAFLPAWEYNGPRSPRLLAAQQPQCCQPVPAITIRRPRGSRKGRESTQVCPPDRCQIF
jgi:hypothetical protein